MVFLLKTGRQQRKMLLAQNKQIYTIGSKENTPEALAAVSADGTVDFAAVIMWMASLSNKCHLADGQRSY